MSKVTGKKTDFGYHIKYNGDEFKVKQAKGHWQIFESTTDIEPRPFKKLKDLKNHISDYYVEEKEESPEKKETRSLWDCVDPACCLALEYADEKRPIPDYVLTTLDCYGLIEDGRPDLEAAKRQLAKFGRQNATPSESGQEDSVDGTEDPKE